MTRKRQLLRFFHRHRSLGLVGKNGWFVVGVRNVVLRFIGSRYITADKCIPSNRRAAFEVVDSSKVE